MPKFILKKYTHKKRLNEEDTTQAQPAAAQQPAAQPAQPAAATTTTTAAQPAAQQPAAQPAQPAAAPAAPQPAAAQTQDISASVTACLDDIRNVVTMNDPYALLAFNLPDKIKTLIPTFDKDPVAKTTIDAWGKFKIQPNKDNFNRLIDAFAKYGAAYKPENAQQAVTAQQTQESMSARFGNKLMKNLHESMTRYNIQRKLTEEYDN